MHSISKTLFASVAIVLLCGAARADTVRPADLKLRARLVTSPQVAHCGILHVIVPMEYEVEQVERGPWPGKRIVVYQSCPELPRAGREGSLKAFRVGDVHRLILTRTAPSPKVTPVLDDRGRDLPRFWPLRVDLAAR